MNYQIAEELLEKSRKGNYVKLKNQTYLTRDTSGNICLVLHRTTVALMHSDGSSTLDSGGFQTPTTKDRLNMLTAANIYQQDFSWYVTNAGNPVPFFDGVKIDSQGRVLNPA